MTNILKPDEAYAICELVDKTIFELIREDEDVDSLQWLRNLIHGYEKLCAYSGYVGHTEEKPRAEE